MVRCNNCGRELESEGQGVYTIQYGFVCYGCSDALHMTICARCGQRFPFSEMVEYEREMYCKPDFRTHIPPIQKAKPSSKPQKKVSTPLGTKIKPKIKNKDYIEPYEVEKATKRILEGREVLSLSGVDRKDQFNDLLGSLRRFIRGK